MTTQATPAAPGTTGFRAYTSAAGTDEREKDETYKRIVGKRNVGDIGKPALMFRLISADPATFGHYLKFWLRIGRKDNGDFIKVPRVSQLPFEDFLVDDGRGGVRVGKTAGALRGCKLAALAEQRHPLIDESDFLDSKKQKKLNIDACHVAHVQLVERMRDAQGTAMKNADGSPRFKVLPDEMFLEMPQAWFDQFANIVDPDPNKVVATAADDDLKGEKKEARVLPTKDLTRVIWMVEKQKRTKNPTGNAKLDVDYIFDFASVTTLKDADMVPVKDPIDMAKAFQVINDEDLNRWTADAEAGWPARSQQGAHQSQGGAKSDEDNAEAYGARVDTGGAAAGASASDDERFR